jgi:hypothetical protein
MALASPAVPTDQLDQWVETARKCKYLAENDLKKLCEIVRRCAPSSARRRRFVSAVAVAPVRGA